MEFSKHKNYRNPAYLVWLRKQNCLISGTSAQCAHHVRLRTNGGKGMKPSDYFCIPLTNDYHTTGMYALHMIGEETFFLKFKVEIEKVFLNQLSLFLKQEYRFQINKINKDVLSAIDESINEIELRRPALNIKNKYVIKKKSKNTNILLKKTSESDYYKKAQEFKRQKDKELRQSIKRSESSNSLDFIKKNEAHKDYYEKSKELKKIYEKENRDKNKLKASELRKELYKRAKEEQKKYKEESL
jgi:hypothetical protein